MSRLAQKQPSVCTSDPLTDDEVCRKMAVLRQILASSFGPCGRLKQVHNSMGGPVLTTSTSGVLLRALTLSHPIPKLLTASVLHHVSRYSDCGLFAGILASALVDRARGLSVQPATVALAYRHLLGLCSDYLSRDDCGCKVPVDLGSSRDLLALVRTVVAAKPACMLTDAEARHVSTQVVRAFLHTVPCSAPGPVSLGKVVVVSVEGRPVGDAAVFPGLLVDTPESLGPSNIERLAEGPLRLALFSASLAGDLPEAGEGTLEVDREVSLEETVLEQLLGLGEQAVRDGVRMLACQRVVHPVLQQYLRRRGVVVLERLGIALMEPLVRLSGAQAVGSFRTPVPVQCYGQLAGLALQRCGSREMLQLLPCGDPPCGDPPCCTLLLCQRTDTALSELKVACESAEHVLRQTLKEPWALLGGGCTETHLSAYIRYQSLSRACDAAAELHCTRSDYLLAAEAFRRSLVAVATALEHDGGARLVDLSHGHCWAVAEGAAPAGPWRDVLGPCGCGAIPPRGGLEWSPLSTEHPAFSPAPPVATDATDAQPRVLDSFPAKRNALQVAVETANLILDLKYIVQDVN